MRVLLVSPDADNGGQGIGIKRAFDRFSDIEVRSVTVDDNYLRYEQDWVWPRDREQILDFHPDLYHFRRNPELCTKMLGTPDKLIVHHHGTEFRDDMDAGMAWAAEHNARVLVATLDLNIPGTTWLPAPHDVPALQAMADPIPGRVIHAPTNRHVKNSFDFFAASKGLDVDLIEHRTHQECLQRKSKGWVLYDQMTYGYGLNGIEAMCMGIPVVGSADSVTTDRMRKVIGFLPFMQTVPEHLAADLRSLIERPDLHRSYANAGTAYVEYFHAQPKVVERLTDIWCSSAS